MTSRRCLLVALLAIPATRGAAQQGGAQQGASIAGTVRDSARRPIADVEVGVLGAGVRVRTDAAGAYRIPGILPGRAVVSARRLGYRSATQAVRLLAGDVRRVDFALLPAAQVLEEQATTARREISDARLAGFNERSRLSIGHFVTRERIERANSSSVIDVLREVPGLRISGPSSQIRRVRIRSSTCPPLVFLDGIPASAGEFDLDMIDLRSLEGIEVYTGMGSTPPEFTGPRDLARCGVIALWSRPARPRARVAPALPDTVVASPVAAAFTQDEVDEPAREGDMPVPAYPDSLVRAGIGGRVVVEVVVDTAGRVEPGSVEVLESAHPALSDVVRAALTGARYHPARRQGRPVRQYVQRPFVFVPPPG